MNMRIISALFVSLLMLPACAGADEVQDVGDESLSGAPEVWPVGPEFTADEFTHNGVTHRHTVTATAFTSSSVNVDLSVCPYGGGADYQIIDSRFVMDGFASDAMECLPEDPDLLANAKLLDDLFLSGPSISIGGDQVTIENEETRLVLRTNNPEANQPIVPIETMYRGVSSSNPNIVPSKVSIILPAFFVVNVGLESCLAHAQAGELGGDGPWDFINGVNLADCPNPTPSDQAVLDLLNSQPKLTNVDGRLVITAPDGTNLVLEPD